MTKRTSKTRAPKKARAKEGKPKVGGARAGSGPKPKLGAGVVRSVIKTVRLSTGEHDAQLAAVKRFGAKDWAEWARPILNAAADISARSPSLSAGGAVMFRSFPADDYPGATKLPANPTSVPAPAASSDHPCAMDGCRGCGVCQPGAAEAEARRRDALEGPH